MDNVEKIILTTQTIYFLKISAAVMGMLGGFLPSVRAARLKIIDSLRAVYNKRRKAYKFFIHIRNNLIEKRFGLSYYKAILLITPEP